MLVRNRCLWNSFKFLISKILTVETVPALFHPVVVVAQESWFSSSFIIIALLVWSSLSHMFGQVK